MQRPKLFFQTSPVWPDLAAIAISLPNHCFHQLQSIHTPGLDFWVTHHCTQVWIVLPSHHLVKSLPDLYLTLHQVHWSTVCWICLVKDWHCTFPATGSPISKFQIDQEDRWNTKFSCSAFKCPHARLHTHHFAISVHSWTLLLICLLHRRDL